MCVCVFFVFSTVSRCHDAVYYADTVIRWYNDSYFFQLCNDLCSMSFFFIKLFCLTHRWNFKAFCPCTLYLAQHSDMLIWCSDNTSHRKQHSKPSIVHFFFFQIEKKAPRIHAPHVTRWQMRERPNTTNLGI